MEVKVTDKNFAEEVLKSDIPVLVDFWAAWCMPCLAVAPAIAQIAKDYKGRIKVVKINVDEAGATAQQCQVQSIPTLAIYKNGEEVERSVGALPKAHLESMIKPYLNSKN